MELEVKFIKDILYSEYKEDPMQRRWRFVGQKLRLPKHKCEELIKDGYAVYAEEPKTIRQIVVDDNKSIEKDTPMFTYECKDCGAISKNKSQTDRCLFCEKAAPTLLSHPIDYTPVPSETFQAAAKIFSGKMELAKRFYDVQPIYYDNASLWWLWSNEKKCWEMTDEVTISNYLYTSINYDTINAKERGEILQALKQIGRMYRPKDMPKTWIQFKDVIIDLSDGTKRPATKEYFTLNPIPYPLHKDQFINTPTMDRIFTEWVGEEHVKTLYEILGYCCLSDYPLHRLFCFIGNGMNGKSCYLRLIEKFIGLGNCCSTELDSLLNSRFEVTRLHKKLVCMMGETNFNEISKTSILKKLTGQDMIGYEYKNKNPFEERNYAKILISTNNLPETTDKTIGFYRRWLIIDFPNGFSEEKDILGEIPEEEYEALATKLVAVIIPDLLRNRRFYNEGTVGDRAKNYEEKSNPFDKFLKETVEEEVASDIPKWEFSKRLNEWCKANKFREMSDIVIAKKMKDRNVQETKPYREWYEGEVRINRQVRCWGGLKWKF